MKVILNNGVELEAIQVNGQMRYFQGENRDSIEFQFTKTAVTFDQLDVLFSSQENTKRIMLTVTTTNGDGQEVAESYLHENYTLRASLSSGPVVITPSTGTELEVTEDRYSVVMAQKTYAELQQDALQDTVDILVLESLGV